MMWILVVYAVLVVIHYLVLRRDIRSREQAISEWGAIDKSSERRHREFISAIERGRK